MTSATIPENATQAEARVIFHVKRIMRERDIRQGELADRLGVQQPVVSQWLSRRFALRVSLVDRIADALEIDAQELFAPIPEFPG